MLAADKIRYLVVHCADTPDDQPLDARDIHQMQAMTRGIEAGRIWCNCYHDYPSHASFGGYKKSGIGRETHKMMLNHYRHTKNVITSYSKSKLGFF